MAGRHSRARLQLTQPMLLKILTAYQIMPSYLELLSAFGEQSDPKNSRFSAFYKQDFTRQPTYPATLLGNGGKHLGICYSLRGVAPKIVQTSDGPQVEWSIRSAAILHQLDLEQGRALWLVTHGRRELLQRYDDLQHAVDTAPGTQQGDFARRIQDSLHTHLMLCDWSTEGWTAYISFLEDVVAKEARIPPNCCTEVRQADLLMISRPGLRPIYRETRT